MVAYENRSKTHQEEKKKKLMIIDAIRFELIEAFGKGSKAKNRNAPLAKKLPLKTGTTSSTNYNQIVTQVSNISLMLKPQKRFNKSLSGKSIIKKQNICFSTAFSPSTKAIENSNFTIFKSKPKASKDNKKKLFNLIFSQVISHSFIRKTKQGKNVDSQTNISKVSLYIHS